MSSEAAVVDQLQAAAPSVADANDTQPSPPKQIESRYVSRLRNAWDAKLRLGELQTAFKEAIITVRHHATEEYNMWTSRLQDALTVLGSTRHRERAKELGADGRTFAEQRDEYERRVEHWEGIRGRCSALLEELEEHISEFTDEFLRIMPKITEEVMTAPWDDPRDDPWAHLMHFNDPRLLEIAREIPAVTIDRSCFQVNEAHCWCSAPRSRLPGRTRSGALKISCCAIQTTTTPFLLPETEIFFGTADGDVLAVNFGTLAKGRSELHEYVVPQDANSEGAPLPTTVEDVTKSLSERVRNQNRALREAGEQESAASPTVPAAVALPLGNKTTDDKKTAKTDGKPASPKTANNANNKVDDQQLTKPAKATPPGVRVFRGHAYRVVNLCYVKGPTERNFLVSVSEDKTARVSNADTGALISVLTSTAGMISGVCYHDGIGYLISAARDGMVAVWDLLTGDRMGILAKFSVPLHSIYAEGGPAGLIFVGTKHGHIYGLSVTSFRPQKQSLEPIGFTPCPVCFLPQGALPIYSPPGSVDTDATFASSCDTEQKVARGSHKAARITTFSSVAGFLLSGDSSGLVVQWDLLNAVEVRALPGHVDDVTAIHVATDGFMFTSSRDGLLLIRNLNDGTLLTRLNRHFAPSTGLILGLVCVPGTKLPKLATSPASGPSASQQGEERSAWSSAGYNSHALSLSALPEGTHSLLLSFSEDESIVGWHLHYDLSSRHGF